MRNPLAHILIFTPPYFEQSVS